MANETVPYHSTLKNEGDSIRPDITSPLGKAIDGAISFKGEYNGISVTVKRYARKEDDPVPSEVKVMRYIEQNIQHPNVARYYCVEQCPAFWLIATQLGQCSLYDYLKRRARCPDFEIDSFIALHEITQGLNALHSRNIAHRDIRPGSIILSFPDADSHCRAMIEGFAMSKLIRGELEMSDEHHQRRYGWQAPEILQKEQQRCRASPTEQMLAGDIFALGCLFYYVLSNGNHPFGNDRKERDGNVLSQDYTVRFEADLFKRYYGAQSLITSMIQRDPINRLKISEVMNHPMFWTKEQILGFFEQASEHLENNPGDLKLRVNGLLGAICPPPQRNDWIVHVDPILVDQLNGRRGIKTQLNGQSVLDLLRAIRNSKHHYKGKDWTPEVKNLFGSTNGSFFQYWLKRFPELLLQLWQTLQVLKDHPDFKTYYDGTLRKSSPANAVRSEHF